MLLILVKCNHTDWLRPLNPHKNRQTCLSWLDWSFALVPRICWVNLVWTLRSGYWTVETRRGEGGGVEQHTKLRLFIALANGKEQSCRYNKCWLPHWYQMNAYLWRYSHFLGSLLRSPFNFWSDNLLKKKKSSCNYKWYLSSRKENVLWQRLGK